jgi:hypothetical protein
LGAKDFMEKRLNQLSIESRLRDRALIFHKILSDNKVYWKAISDADFLQSTNDKIQRTAKSISVGEGTPWLTLLTFPLSLLFRVREYIYLQSWDTEEGIDGLLEELQELFDKASVPFQWEYNEETQRLEFQTGNSKASRKCKSLENLHYGFFEGSNSMLPSINIALQKRGQYLYSIADCGQVATYVLLPLAAVEPIRKILITDDQNLPDERAGWMWKGMPDNKKDMDMWNL